MNNSKSLRKEIIDKTIEYFHLKHSDKQFVPGKSKVNYAGRVFNEKELTNAVDASLDFWLTEGRFSEEFEDKIYDYLDVENVLLTKSGSSANMLAFAELTNEKLGDRRLKTGDEVIAVDAG